MGNRESFNPTDQVEQSGLIAGASFALLTLFALVALISIFFRV